jgi:hypothetical protein
MQEIQDMSNDEANKAVAEGLDGARDAILELCTRTAMNPLIGDDFIGAETSFENYGPIGVLVNTVSEGAVNLRVKIEFLGDLGESGRSSQKIIGLVLLRSVLQEITGILGAFAHAREVATGEDTGDYFEGLLQAFEAEPQSGSVN